MKTKTSHFLGILVPFAILLGACSGQIAVTPTSTETVTPLPTSTSTSTVTPPPTETPIPQPASLSGVVYLSDGNTNPFVSSVELRQGDEFTLVASSQTDSNGAYRIENIPPGIYGLWIFITSEATIISRCNDVAPPDSTWKIGIQFVGGMGLTMENAYLSKALLLVENLPSSSDLKAEAFFAVLDGFEVKPGVENQMDVMLICK